MATDWPLNEARPNLSLNFVAKTAELHYNSCFDGFVSPEGETSSAQTRATRRQLLELAQLSPPVVEWRTSGCRGGVFVIARPACFYLTV